MLVGVVVVEEGVVPPLRASRAARMSAMLALGRAIHVIMGERNTVRMCARMGVLLGRVTERERCCVAYLRYASWCGRLLACVGEGRDVSEEGVSEA